MRNDPSDRLELQKFLVGDERLIWTDRPGQGLRFDQSPLYVNLFCILWAGFAFFWNAGVWFGFAEAQGDIWYFRLFGLPFLAVGVWMVFGRFWHDAQVRKSQIYGLTSQRVLIVSGGSLKSLPLARLDALELEGGDVVRFGGPVNLSDPAAGFAFFAPALSRNALLYIDDAPDVLRQIEVARQAL